MKSFDDDKLMGKTVQCMLKNNEIVTGTISSYDNKSIVIEGLYIAIVSVDYIGALVIL